MKPFAAIATLARLARLPLFALALLASSSAFACRYDIDCRPGAKCVKNSGNMFGACKSAGVIGDARMFEGLERGADKKGADRKQSKLNPNHTYSQSCTFDSECSLSYRCSRITGGRTGLCVRISTERFDPTKPPANEPTATTGASRAASGGGSMRESKRP
jgi:hypothetical protein